jgi:hypothetical protein
MASTDAQTRPTVLMIRSQVKPEHADDVQEAAGRMFAAIEREQLAGIRYTSARHPDGVTYVALLEVQRGVENPLPALPEFREFQDSLAQWLAGPPTPEPLTVIGSYRAF